MTLDMTSLATLITSGITSAIAIISCFYIYFREISDIKTRVVSLETKITPFWNWIDRNLPSLLHSPHTPQLDKLLENYQCNKDMMSTKELEELKYYLEQEINHTPKDKIFLYVLMIGGVESSLSERIRKKK